MTVPKPEKKKSDRLSTVERDSWSRDSLVGSFFHGNADKGWQGCVVAEPSPGFYLVELFSWIAGESTNQQLVKLDDMLDWQFYDDAKWMNSAYEHGGVKQRWDYLRAQKQTAEGDAA